MKPKSVEILCTVGPSSLNERFMKYAEFVGVSLLRINLSHTKTEDLPKVIKKIKAMSSIPICIDSEGSQIRTDSILGGSIDVRENSYLTISHRTVLGNSGRISLNPLEISRNFQVGDFISIDFNSVFGQVVSVTENCAELKILIGGKIGQNKAVTVQREIPMPAFTKKDLECLHLTNVEQRVGI